MALSQVHHIEEDVKQHFGFLKSSGYVMGPVRQLPRGEWEMTCDFADHRLFLRSDRGDIVLSFAPVAGHLQDRFAIQVMIYYLSGGATFIGRIMEGRREARPALLERLAGLARQYRERIVPFFGAQFDAYRPELMIAKDRYIEEFITQSAAGEA